METFCGDILTRPFEIKFDYIVGNPPYISYRNLEKEVREYIKKSTLLVEKESQIIVMPLLKTQFSIWR